MERDVEQHEVGPIKGAFGTVHDHDGEGQEGWKYKLLTFFAILGPGIIVMVGDNDAGGISTYSQAGQDFGYSLLWVLPLLIPVLIVNQEMVVRLGAVTGVGHAKLIRERFGKFWAWFSVADLFLLNFLTIATEFIGVGLALDYFGVSQYISVPIAAIGLIVMTASGSFQRWEQFMFVFVVINFLVIPLAVLSHPKSFSSVVHGLTGFSIAGGATSSSVLLIIAIVGTTIAPWQLFFQQSNIIDKRITTRFVNYERVDTVLGSFVVVFAAVLLVCVVAAGTYVPGHHHGFTDALGVAHLLEHSVSKWAGAFFAIILLNASLIGAAAVTLATSYAFGDVFTMSTSLHQGWRDAKAFYGAFAGIVSLAAFLILLPGAPLGLIVTVVQALAGVLLPSATVFLLLLCNDRAVLGPWVNGTWLNVVAIFIVSILMGLSLILMINTVFPNLDVTNVALWLGVGLGVCYLAGIVGFIVARRRNPPAHYEFSGKRENWRMPPVALLERPKATMARRWTMYLMAGYLVLAVLLLFIKGITLAAG